MYRIWYSKESLADFIVENTDLRTHVIEKHRLLESDARLNDFHAMPDHIKQILELDCPDLIIERAYQTHSEPILSIEISQEAGTGHNVFQRFARIVSALEHGIPSFYIYPKAKIVTRDGSTGWDPINPLIFYALEELMDTFEIPGLFYYFPSDYDNSPDYTKSSYKNSQGLIYSTDIRFLDCPDATDDEMIAMFNAINVLIENVEISGSRVACKKILKNKTFKQRRKLMQKRYYSLSDGEDILQQSPNTSTVIVPTQYLINYLRTAKYEDPKYESLLLKRENTVIYMPGAKDLRADPYAGCLTAIDYMQCRSGDGLTFEDRESNLVLAFGKITVNHDTESISVCGQISVEDFCAKVITSERRNLLTKTYSELKKGQIPRYYMQVRHGSTYSKNKAIRIYAHFADAILFKDGALWREN